MGIEAAHQEVKIKTLSILGAENTATDNRFGGRQDVQAKMGRTRAGALVISKAKIEPGGPLRFQRPYVPSRFDVTTVNGQIVQDHIRGTAAAGRSRQAAHLPEALAPIPDCTHPGLSC